MTDSWKTKMKYPVRVERTFIEGFLSENGADFKAFEKVVDQCAIFPCFTATLAFWLGCLYSKNYLQLFLFVFAGYVIGLLNFFHHDVFFTLYAKKIYYFFESRTFRLFNLILICSFCIFSKAYVFIPVFLAGCLAGVLAGAAVDLIYRKRDRYGHGLLDRQVFYKLTDFIADPWSRKDENVVKEYEAFKKGV